MLCVCVCENENLREFFYFSEWFFLSGILWAKYEVEHAADGFVTNTVTHEAAHSIKICAEWKEEKLMNFNGTYLLALCRIPPYFSHIHFCFIFWKKKEMSCLVTIAQTKGGNE